MISQAFYYSRARQQTKKRQLIDHQLSFSFSCAQDKNNDILLRYTNKRKNVRIATYTHVFFMLKHYSCGTNFSIICVFYRKLMIDSSGSIRFKAEPLHEAAAGQ